MQPDLPPFGHNAIAALDRCHLLTLSRRVLGQVVKMPGPRQPGQAEEQLGYEEPGPVAPSDAALQRLYIA